MAVESAVTEVAGGIRSETRKVSATTPSAASEVEALWQAGRSARPMSTSSPATGSSSR